MPKAKRNGRKKAPAKKKVTDKKKAAAALRAGEIAARVPNSGLEVWLYDDANRDAIRRSGAMNFMSGPPQEQESLAAQTKAFAAATKGGLLVGSPTGRGSSPASPMPPERHCTAGAGTPRFFSRISTKDCPRFWRRTRNP